ncbi:MAG: DNA polymerase III subunit gamma and tau [Tetrasphaera sp.]
MSTALYRRYRPDTFADVIGQEHVTEPLARALDSGRINHAYLFSGPRGCGKTTSARILARCLNCEQGPTSTPCGSCDSCVALARGGAGSIDVIEIDAASHGGVDDARELRERAAFAPAESRFKVYIIDEAHMVTTQGFNALLKIVEEPPPHVKFVFATTEPEKVIGTIRSRTHHYPFRLVPPARLHDYLGQLAAAEGVDVEPGVLSFVVRAGGGSVRDSLSVLDQLIAGSDERGLTYEGAAALLGFTDAELLDAVVNAFASGDAAEVFRRVEQVVETGLDPRRFVEDLLERFRDLIVLAAVPEAGASVLRGLPSDQIDRMRVQAGAFGPGALSHSAEIVNAGLTEMTGATTPRLQLELIAARVLLPGAVGERGYAARLDRLERRLDVGGVPSGVAPGAGGAPPPAAAAPAAATRVAGPPEPGRAAALGSPGGADGDRDNAGRRDRARGQGGFAGRGPAGRGLADAGSGGEGEGGELGAAAGEVRDDAPTGGGAEADGGAAVDEGAGAVDGVAAAGGGAGSGPGARPPSPARGRGPAGPGGPGESAGAAGRRGPVARGSAPLFVPAAGPGAGAPQGQDVRATTNATDAVEAGAVLSGPAPGGLDVAALRRSWPDVLAKIFTLKRTTWTFLSEHAQVVGYDGRTLVLGIATTGLANTFRAGVHADIVRQALIDVLGLDVRVDAVVGSGGQGAGGTGQGGGGTGHGHSSGGAAATPGARAGGPASAQETSGAPSSKPVSSPRGRRDNPTGPDGPELGAPWPDDAGPEAPWPDDAWPNTTGPNEAGPPAREQFADAHGDIAPDLPSHQPGGPGTGGVTTTGVNTKTAGRPAQADQAAMAAVAARDWSGGGTGWGSAPSSTPPSWATEHAGRPAAEPGPSDRPTTGPPPTTTRRPPPDQQASISQQPTTGHVPTTSAGSSRPPGSATSAAADQAVARPPGARPEHHPPSRPAAAAGPARSRLAGEADEDLVSDDDEDLVDLGEVGQPVVERLLGGTVIWSESDQP